MQYYASIQANKKEAVSRELFFYFSGIVCQRLRGLPACTEVIAVSFRFNAVCLRLMLYNFS